MRLVHCSFIHLVLLLTNIVQVVLSDQMSAYMKIDLLQHVVWNRTDLSVMTPIPGSSPHSTAHQLSGSRRHIEVEAGIVEQVLQLIETNEDFTLLASVKQQQNNTGSIISIQVNGKRLLELESSGRRDEIRLHYLHEGQTRTETLPYRLADNRWHLVALSFSSHHCILHIDCNKVYERALSSIDSRSFSSSSSSSSSSPSSSSSSSHSTKIWLGQRNSRNALFKGAIEYVQLIGRPQGILEQCPHASVACPSCSQFMRLEQSIEMLISQINTLTQKLTAAERRLEEVENCECTRGCDFNGAHYHDGQTWSPDLCTTCTCSGGSVKCEPKQCPSLTCKYPVTLDGQCCPVCLRQCFFHDKYYDHGESYKPYPCVNCVCQDGKMSCVREKRTSCPVLTCPRHEQFSVPGQCCDFCRGTDYCSLGHDCHSNASCTNLATRYSCQCNTGFHGDGKTCTDRDECARRGGRHGHHCHSNTVCVNTPGSYECQCLPGFRRIDQFTCQEHDECATGSHQCDRNALCENTHGNYTCTCRRGFRGNGYSCDPICSSPCRNGGECVAPDTCQCRKGFLGKSCQLDIDECRMGTASCAQNSVCVNLPGTYYCQCKPGYHSNTPDNQLGSLCTDINECDGWSATHECPPGTYCVNTRGSYTCVCHNHQHCRAACTDGGEVHLNGTTWSPGGDSCATCSCKNGNKKCRLLPCDCSDSNVNAECCPQCVALKERCQHQELDITYDHGDKWIHQCQQCQCVDGEVDCWSLRCPRLACTEVIQREGDCCPRCVTGASPSGRDSRDRGSTERSADTGRWGDWDPCLSTLHPAGSLLHTAAGCYYGGRVFRWGETWTPAEDMCSTCECRGGHVCCQSDQSCSVPAEPHVVTSRNTRLQASRSSSWKQSKRRRRRNRRRHGNNR